jgi:hypothetical protein
LTKRRLIGRISERLPQVGCGGIERSMDAIFDSMTGSLRLKVRVDIGEPPEDGTTAGEARLLNVD